MSLLSATLRFLTNARSLDVSVVDGNGDQITSFSGSGPFDPSRPANAAITSVASSITSVQLLASHAARRQVIIVNDGNRALLIAFAATATTAAYTLRLGGGQEYVSVLNSYTGEISGIWNVANGSAVITEITT